ncbi:MAG: phosphate acetyltransferase, partial [Gammaproteobacteria bacterium]|nr:phosphate acetyltransferase [Gammaproteobacteria bacterium]
DELVKLIIARFQRLQERYTTIVCEGVDFGGTLPGQELDFNLELANHLNCQLVPVLNAHGRNGAEVEEDLISLVESLLEKRCQTLAIMVNHCREFCLPPEGRERQQRRVEGIPIYPVRGHRILEMPTVGEVAHALQAEVIAGGEEGMSQEVSAFKVAAMELPHFLNHISDGSLIITPGDRADIIVGSLVADRSSTYPKIAGILLSGGISPDPGILKLIEGLSLRSLPLLLVGSDTFNTALEVTKVEPRLGPNNPRKIAAALGLMEELPISREELFGQIAESEHHRITPIRFEFELIQRAKLQKKHIVLPEGEEERVLRAEILLLRDVVQLTLLGDGEKIQRQIAQLGLKLEQVEIIDPSRSPLRQHYAEALFQARQHKGITLQMAWDMVEDVSYFGTLMVHCGDADGMVSGAVHTTQHTIRPAFQVIRTRPGHDLISSVFLMSLPDRVVVYGDCAVNPEPTSTQLADIAITSAATALRFGIEPRVAMLSYSTGGSGVGGAVEKVRNAVAIARQRRPDLKIEGPIQFDAAVDSRVARTKLPESELAGNATVFIFPDLNSGNNTYKAVQRSSGAVAIGPILQGLNRPVNDLSRGCTVTDIVNTVALTAIQSQES